MDEKEFEAIVAEEWARVPEQFKGRMENMALLVEDEPSAYLREVEKLEDGEMLLGIYQGVPLTERGEGYGTGGTLPDTITIYRLPTLLEAAELFERMDGEFSELVQKVVRDTLWHEVGHYFGHGDEHIYEREDEGTNRFKAP